MNPIRVLPGIFLVLIGYLLLLRHAIFYVPVSVVIVGIVLVVYGVKPSTVTLKSRKVLKATYDGVVSLGLSRIDRGILRTDRQNFLNTVDKIKDFISTQQLMPEFGLDCIFMQFRDQTSAERAVEDIRRRGITADAMQEKDGWRVRVNF